MMECAKDWFVVTPRAPKLVSGLTLSHQNSLYFRCESELGPVVFGSIDEQIDFLQARNLTSRQPKCPSCGPVYTSQK